MITRNWLRSLGASAYLAKRLTKDLAIAGYKGRSYAYPPELVLASVETYGQNPRIRPKTKQVLTLLGEELSQLMNALRPNTPSSSDAADPLAAAMAKVSQANAQFDATAAKAQKISSEFETYRSERGSDFKSRNNVVTFA